MEQANLREQIEKEVKIGKVAGDVIKLSRNTLLVNMRFLDRALNQLALKAINDPDITYTCDGKTYVYNPRYVLKRYMKESEIPTRDYFHAVMHCVFRHMFIDTSMDKRCWDLACDIAVENAINDLDEKCVTPTMVANQRAVIEHLKSQIKTLTAERIYRYYLDNPVSEEEFERLRGLFLSDDHAPWYDTEGEKDGPQGGGSNNEDPNGGGQGDGDGDQNDDPSDNPDDQDQNQDSDDNDEPDNSEEPQDNPQDISDEELEERWKEISERMETEVSMFSKKKGERPGDFMQNLMALNREKYNYEAFLKKFATRTEVMKINDDEFDYVYYTYGLKLYEKMPLVEPLEYKDDKKVKEFVVVIDTSGSTSGELVQRFMQKTYNIIKSTESFRRKINLHIIQCDAKVQEHVKITSQEEFQDYIDHLKILGGGGTDFRPAFDLVNRLVADKEFQDLKGLIYFTDGYGDFPRKKPAYETAFVFVEEDYMVPEVPPWAIRLVLSPYEID